jgi:UDP-glucose:(heptosyl)LPS alpha-1,3-glucosyltransferase
MHAWVGLRNRYMIRGLRYRCYVAVSSRVARELQLIHAVPPHRIQVIPNGIDLKRFRPAPATRAATRHKLGIPEKAKLLMFAGHEFERKGLGYVIGALTELGQSTWLLVVGSDSARGYRRAAGAAASRIVFAGARTDMPALYAAADAFVLPTYYETFSLVCMEALACGIPVLATRVGGIEDYLEDGVNGFGISRDASTIAQKARLVFADEAQNSRLRAGARATAERFGWDNIASNYASIASQVLSERRLNRHDAE